jgi:hypothetical protein
MTRVLTCTNALKHLPCSGLRPLLPVSISIVRNTEPFYHDTIQIDRLAQLVEHWRWYNPGNSPCARLREAHQDLPRSLDAAWELIRLGRKFKSCSDHLFFDLLWVGHYKRPSWTRGLGFSKSGLLSSLTSAIVRERRTGSDTGRLSGLRVPLPGWLPNGPERTKSPGFARPLFRQFRHGVGPLWMHLIIDLLKKRSADACQNLRDAFGCGKDSPTCKRHRRSLSYPWRYYMYATGSSKPVVRRRTSSVQLAIL